ncbi:hypothetical protein FH972_007405 [Carpinus fangiana]|uniref:tRNA (adenine(58)-N(1))-methyltransferase n=1 Tax=Carpinus fangiana TaxID=176857 RepID=A0A5N6QYI3_9ROSI|nr:hypothetical protein FH972_007405 [Carpinus fangiana]
MLSIDPTKKLSFSRHICDGDLVIVYERHDNMKAVKVSQESVLQNRFGVFKHSDWIGKPFGSKVFSNKGGFIYLLAPTPELWTLVLSHRTQILYIADISFVIMYLEIVPGCLVLESGTGSGSLTTSLARAVAPTGHVYTFDFHEERAASAREDFEKTGISSLVTVGVRDIQGEGFPDEFSGLADSIFLDLPQPWLAIPSAGKMLKPDGVLCSFSPCIEQVQRACDSLRSNFTDLRTFEVLLRTYEVRDEGNLGSLPADSLSGSELSHATLNLLCFCLQHLLLQLNKMQNTALVLSLSTPFLKPPNRTQHSKFTRLSFSSSPTPLGLSFTHRLPPESFLYAFSSSRFNTPMFASFSISSQRSTKFKPRAASSPGNVDDTVKPSGVIKTLQLGAMFGIWYILNIYFNIYNKQVLKVYPFPATVTAFQLGLGTLMIILMWASNFVTRPKITSSQLAVILPLAVAHTMGNLLTNISIGKVAVSFTHTIKAMEPFFTVVLSALFLSEVSDSIQSWRSFILKILYALLFETSKIRRGYKKLMAKEEETLDNVNLLSVITIISFILLVPAAIFLEGVKFSPSYLQSAANQGLNVRELCVRSLMAGFCFHSYQQVSFMILGKVSPVTHAVGNCVKRVVVIVSSVIFFQTPVAPINSLGTAVALAGVFLYSRAKRIKPKPKAA